MYNDLFAVTSVRTGDFQDPQSSLSSRLSCQLPRQVCSEAKWVMAPDIMLSIKISVPVKRIYGSFSGVTCCLFPTQGGSKLYPTLLPKNPNPKHPSLPPSHSSKPHKTPMSLLLPPRTNGVGYPRKSCCKVLWLRGIRRVISWKGILMPWIGGIRRWWIMGMKMTRIMMIWRGMRIISGVVRASPPPLFLFWCWKAVGADLSYRGGNVDCGVRDAWSYTQPPGRQ